MIEKWKKIPGFEKYSVSTLGRVWNNLSGKEVTRTKNDRGYLTVKIYSSRKRVHRLVMEVFEGPSSLEVNHINGNKLDNRYQNLEYCNRQENMDHAKETKLLRPLKGSKHPNSVLNEAKVRKIKALFGKKTHRQIGEEFGVHSSTIGYIRTGRLWTHIKE